MTEIKNNLLEIRDASVTFKTMSGSNIDALNDVNMKVRKGEFLCIVGPSGCGKTTLLRMMGSLIPISSGRVQRNGNDDIDIRRNHGVASVFQDPALLPWRNVLRNAQLPGEIEKDDQVKDAAIKWLRRLGLKDFFKAHPYELSGGMRSRVALARAFSLSPKLLLMDEPFANLDETTRYSLDEEIQHLWKTEGTTIIFVTHSVREAVILADRIAVMSARPGNIKEMIDVDLPRVRTEECLGSLEVTRLVDKVRRLLD